MTFLRSSLRKTWNDFFFPYLISGSDNAPVLILNSEFSCRFRRNSLDLFHLPVTFKLIFAHNRLGLSRRIALIRVSWESSNRFKIDVEKSEMRTQARKTFSIKYTTCNLILKAKSPFHRFSALLVDTERLSMEQQRNAAA